jgi:integrase
MALEARPVELAPWLFCNRDGQCYIDEEKGTADGWDSMWGRFMARVLKETKVTERFTEHDLRAKCASDATSLDHARALLSHADDRMTKRAYRRGAERVRPLR